MLNVSMRVSRGGAFQIFPNIFPSFPMFPNVFQDLLNVSMREKRSIPNVAHMRKLSSALYTTVSSRPFKGRN